jgi:hypothetical protein
VYKFFQTPNPQWVLVESQLPPLGEGELRDLAMYALSAAEHRGLNTERQIVFYAYKNLGSQIPLVFDMGNQNPLRVSKELSNLSQLGNYYPRFPPTTHEYRTLRLRKGDRVEFDERQFELGKFLGAGNTTHIWALAGDSDVALRLPFLAGPLVKKAQSGDSLHQLDFARALVRVYIQKISGLKNAVKVLEYDPKYRWVLVERVHIDKSLGETGLDAMLSSFPRGTPLSDDASWKKAFERSRRELDLRIWQLLILARENRHIPALPSITPHVPAHLREAWQAATALPNTGHENMSLLRQYVLEEGTGLWRVLDTN